jgi:hypothetical protein
MSPAMAARTLLVCFLILGASTVRADLPRPALSGVPLVPASGSMGVRPPGSTPPIRRVVSRQAVAVIDLTDDPAVRDLANKLLDILASNPELAPPAISDGAALVDKLPADDELRIAEANRKRMSAEDNLAQRNFREAAIDAVEGQELLLRVNPRAALPLYADLSLALGQSRLGEKKDAAARESFALTYRLEPRRTLDELHYLPEVVQAFEAAKHSVPGTGTITVRGAGRVWIDGEEVGTAPGEFRASYGRHVIWLTGLLREAGGKEVMVAQGKPGEATILDGPLTRPQKVIRFRNALSQAQDPAARSSAMVALATFVNVHDAILLAQVNGKITYQLWRDREPGFSAIKELGHDTAFDILRPLLPPETDAPPPVVEIPLVVEKRWYQRRSVQLGLAATVVAAIVSGYLWATYQEPARPWDTRIENSGSASKP